MLYKVDDSRWLRLTWAGGIWTGPDLSKQPADVARVIRRWENEMEELEKSEFNDTVLSGIQHRVAIDFFKNTVVRYIDPAAEMNLWTMEHNREEWSDATATRHAHERIVMLATLYAKCVRNYGRRYAETGFTTMLRGAPVYEVEDVGAPDKATQEAEWLDMMNEFELGEIVHLVVRPPVFTAYLSEDRFLILLSRIESWCSVLASNKAIAKCQRHVQSAEPDPESMPALSSSSSSSSTTPISAAPSSSDASAAGPVRKHDKVSRAPKWGGLRQRAGTLAPNKTSGAAAVPRDDEEKQQSIAAGKARAQQLREAEQARVGELVERARIVSIGREIGGC